MKNISLPVILTIAIVAGIPLGMFFYKALSDHKEDKAKAEMQTESEQSTNQKQGEMDEEGIIRDKNGSIKSTAFVSSQQKVAQQDYLEAVECAALIAAMESIKTGNLEPGSNSFNHVSYTLGYAEELAVKAGLDKDLVKPNYDKTTISLYQRLEGLSDEQLTDYDAHVSNCVAKAERLNPDTMVQAALKEAVSNAENNESNDLDDSEN